MLSWISNNYQTILLTTSTIIASASVIVKTIAVLTKNKNDDQLSTWLVWLDGALKKVALNVPKK